MENLGKEVLSSPPKDKNKKWLKVGTYFLTSVVLIALGIVGFWYYQKTFLKKTVIQKDSTSSEKSTERKLLVPGKSPLYMWEKWIKIAPNLTV